MASLSRLDPAAPAIDRLPAVLRSFRLSRRWSQVYAAAAAGLNPGAVTILELRPRQLPSLSKYLRALRYDLADLQAALDRPTRVHCPPVDPPGLLRGRRPFPDAGKHLFSLRLVGPALALLCADQGVTGFSIRQYMSGSHLPQLPTLLLILEGLGSDLAGFQRALQRLRR